MKPRSPSALGHWPLGAALALALALSPAPARADFNMSFNFRWEPGRYTFPEAATSTSQQTGTGTTALPSGNSVNAFQRQDLGWTLGLGFTDKFTMTLGLDIGWASLGVTNGDTTQSQGFTTFGLTVGARWNFVVPAKEKLSPYVAVDFFKYFAALNDTRPAGVAVEQGQVEYAAGLISPWGIRGALGLQYFFSDSFAVGAELGLIGSSSSGSVALADAGGNRLQHTQSLSTLSVFTALTLTFRFPNLVTYGSSRASRYRERDDRE